MLLNKEGSEEYNLDGSEIVTEYSLYQNYPNPFNPSTLIKYSILNPGMVTLTIYDALGKEITQLVNEEQPTGVYEISWNASNFPSGIYFCRIQSGSFIQTNKMVLIK
jgi:hypothetical protein